MNRAVTSHEVARLAGVSQATVSRVLRDDARVRPATREKVLRVLAETKYEPNAAARAIRGRSTGSIGVVVARLSYQLYPAMLEAIGAQLAQLERRMIVWDAGQGDDEPAVRALRQGIVDGVILTAATSESRFLREVNSPEAPVVLINRTVDTSPADQVSSDNSFGGERVSEYLVRCGRRRIALIGGVPRASTIRDRESGFRAGLARAGIALLPQYYRHSETFSHASGREAAIRLLELGSPPDSVFCVNDVLAAGAIDGARHLGLKVPDDVWIVGYDDIEMASWDAYDLTTVRQPMDEMIACGIELLLGRIAEPGRAAERRCFPNDLVIRGSTGRHPFPGPGSGRRAIAAASGTGTRRTRNDHTKASQ
ncbi:MAG: LacI family DNA-binding transcriptional regulator [Burkholderiaceae bacterium]|nr:LacI family DNA-binding transcriptional regulator [Burkholderiaceae bacterium]